MHTCIADLASVAHRCQASRFQTLGHWGHLGSCSAEATVVHRPPGMDPYPGHDLGYCCHRVPSCAPRPAGLTHTCMSGTRPSTPVWIAYAQVPAGVTRLYQYLHAWTLGARSQVRYGTVPTRRCTPRSMAISGGAQCNASLHTCSDGTVPPGSAARVMVGLHGLHTWHRPCCTCTGTTGPVWTPSVVG